VSEWWLSSCSATDAVSLVDVQGPYPRQILIFLDAGILSQICCCLRLSVFSPTCIHPPTLPHTSPTHRLAESLEYSCLLDQAAAESASVDRLMLVAVWVLTCYNSQVGRCWGMVHWTPGEAHGVLGYVGAMYMTNIVSSTGVGLTY
jgi:hypothetical protein